MEEKSFFILHRDDIHFSTSSFSQAQWTFSNTHTDLVLLSPGYLFLRCVRSTKQSQNYTMQQIKRTRSACTRNFWKNIWGAMVCRVLSFFCEYAEDLTVYYFLAEEYKWLLPETRVRYSIIVTWNMSYSMYNGGLGIPQERGNITRWTDCWNVQLVFGPCRR